MSSRTEVAHLLARTQDELAEWRRTHGGPGRRIPEELWAAAAEVAREQGVAPTARRLRLRAERLEQLVVALDDAERGRSFEFVEFQCEKIGVPGQTVLQLVGRDGEQLRIEVPGTRTVDLVSIARAFWSRG